MRYAYKTGLIVESSVRLDPALFTPVEDEKKTQAKPPAKKRASTTKKKTE